MLSRYPNTILLNGHGTVVNPYRDFTGSERLLTSCPARIPLQARTGEDRRAAPSTPGAAPVVGRPHAATRHVWHLAVTARKCPERAVCTEAAAGMKNPSKAALLQRGRRLPPSSPLCGRASAPWTRADLGVNLRAFIRGG